MIQFKRRTPVRDFTRSLLRGLAALVIISFGVAAASYAVQEGWLVLPEEQVSAITSFVKEQTEGPPVASTDRARLPDDFDWWLEQLALKQAEAIRTLPSERSSYELCWRGRSRMLLLGDDDLIAARDLLELALVLEPKNVLALSGLAEVYALIGISDTSRSELLVWAQWLLRRADSVGGYGLERGRARAQWLLSGGEDREAAVLIREALRTDPDDAHFHFLHGIAQASDQRATAAAIGAFERALELEPDMGRVWLEIGRLEERRGRYGPAAKAYREELASGGAGSGTHRALGLLMERVGQFSEASEHYRRSVALDPVQADLALRRAVIAYQVEGKPQQAREFLRRVLAGEHGALGLAQRQEVKVHLSAVLRIAGEYRGAIRIAEELLIDEASYAPALFHLGLAQVEDGQQDTGEGTLLRLDSSGLTSLARARVHFHAGQAALLRGRTPDAIAGFGRAVDARPDFLPAYFWLLVAQLGRGDEEVVAESSLRFLGRDPLEWSRPRELSLIYGPPPQSQEVARRITDAVPASRRGPKLSLALAIAQFHSGELRTAEELLRLVLARDARSDGAKFYLGLIALSRQQAEVAVLFLESAVESSHNNAVYHAYLGEALILAGRIDEAVESLERARALGDGSAWLDTRSGVIQAKRGLPSEAVTLLERAEAAAPDTLDPRAQRYRLDL
jgi:tetratricopeptide (TPR) repeat protein